MERRENLAVRARKRFDTYSEKVRAKFGGSKTKTVACLELCVVPRFPSRQLCQQEALKERIENTRMRWRTGMFPDPSSVIRSQHESAIVIQPVGDFSAGMSIFEANVWGMLFYGVQIETNQNGTMAIHLYRVVGCVLLLIQHASRMLRIHAYAGPVLIETTLASILDIQWLHGSDFGVVARPGSELDDNVSFSIETASDALRDQPDGVAAEILRYIMFSINKADLVDTRQRLEEVVLKGYDFNSWTRPSSLRM